MGSWINTSALQECIYVLPVNTESKESCKKKTRLKSGFFQRLKKEALFSNAT
jgi:hypothetical protein